MEARVLYYSALHSLKPREKYIWEKTADELEEEEKSTSTSKIVPTKTSSKSQKKSNAIKGKTNKKKSKSGKLQNSVEDPYLANKSNPPSSKNKAEARDAIDHRELIPLIQHEPLSPKAESKPLSPKQPETHSSGHGSGKAEVPDYFNIYFDCQPIDSFWMKVLPTMYIEDLMQELAKRVFVKTKQSINVLKLQIGENDVKKALPPEFTVNTILEERQTVFVEYTTNKSTPNEVVAPQDDGLGPRGPFLCPFTFNSKEEVKQHLAKSGIQMPKVPLRRKGEQIRCPIIFYNREDANNHIQAEVAGRLERLEPDLRTFWERTEEIIQTEKKKVELKQNQAKSDETMNELLQIFEKEKELEKQKKDQKSQKNKQRKAKELEKKKKMKEKVESKQKEQEALKEKQQQIQEQQRKHKNATKSIREIVMDIIQNVESISMKVKPTEIVEPVVVPKPKTKKKKTKKKNGQKNKNIPVEPIEISVPEPPKVSNPPNGIPKAEAAAEKSTKSPPNGLVTTPTPMTNGITTKAFQSRRLVQVFNQELDDYFMRVKPLIESQKIKATSMYEKIAHVVSTIWENASVKVYGSFAHGLCIPSSDVDLVIIGVQADLSESINKLAAALSQQPWKKSLQVIETAKVPVVKITSIEENIPTDISFDGIGMATFPTSEGLLIQHAGVATVELVNSYSRKMPDLLPVTTILKQLLYENNLNNSYTGGLSSYCLIIMIISFLQLRQVGRENSSNSPKETVAELLVDFLELYGKKFDYYETGISISNGGKHFRLKESPFTYPGTLVIVDPFNPANNISQNITSTAVQNVKQHWAEAHAALTSPFYQEFTPTVVLERVLKRLDGL